VTLFYLGFKITAPFGSSTNDLIWMGEVKIHSIVLYYRKHKYIIYIACNKMDYSTRVIIPINIWLIILIMRGLHPNTFCITGSSN